MGRRSLARPQEGPPEGEEVDTSEELRQRRSLARPSLAAIPDNVLQRLSLSSRGSTLSAPPCSPNMFFNCLKLSAQNKITPKNAFSLSMIDYMSVAVHSEKSLITNFQIASCSLDACVKIYSARVDHVAGNVAECAMTLSMMNKKGGLPSEEGEPGMDQQDDDQQPKKPKKKAKSKSSVLAADPSDLVLDMTKSAPKNKMFSLVGNLMDESLDSITFRDRSRNGAVPGMTRAELEKAPGGDTKVTAKWPVLKKGSSICASFSDFRFTREKDPGSTISSHKSSRKSRLSQRVTFGPQDDADLEFEDPVFEDDFAGGTITEEVAACTAAPRAALHLHNADSLSKDNNLPFAAKMPAMFCFDQENKMPTLHGPSYWRYKKPRTLTNAAPVKRRVVAPPAPIDFKRLIDLSKLRKSKAKTYVTRDTLVRWNPERLMMPFETDLDGGSIEENEQSVLDVGLCNPLRIVDPRTTKGSHTDKTPLRFSYNYNNEVDKQDYCPFPEQPILASDDDEDDYASGTENLVEDGVLNNLFQVPDESANTSLTFRGEKNLSLVPVPQNLVQTVAPVWKTVKGINMRHIEANIWKEIEETGGKTQDEKLAARWRFSDLRKGLPLKTQENASVATTLYALLNVANKKGLELTGNPKHSDLQVRRLRTKPKEKEARVHPALLGYDVDD